MANPLAIPGSRTCDPAFERAIVEDAAVTLAAKTKAGVNGETLIGVSWRFLSKGSRKWAFLQRTFNARNRTAKVTDAVSAVGLAAS